jgi:hypothetical protein
MKAEPDDYYAEIQILIDGWPWNLADRPPRRFLRFPSADRLCLQWDIEARNRARKIA